jgi:hypothetical protein
MAVFKNPNFFFALFAVKSNCIAARDQFYQWNKNQIALSNPLKQIKRILRNES